MRNTWAAYLVNIDTGKIEWTLGGKRSSFKFGPGAAFQWQHDVKLRVRGSTVTMFDDHCCQLTGGGTSVPATGPSRGLVLKLDQQTHTATLVAQYPGGGKFETEYMGDTQPLAERQHVRRLGLGTLLLGVQPVGQAAAGRELPRFRPELPRDAGAVGRPAALLARGRRPPDGRQDHGVRELERRHPGRVLEGPGRGRRRSADRRGERREVRVRDGDRGAAGYKSFEVQALDADGRVIGASRLFTLAGD